MKDLLIAMVNKIVDKSSSFLISSHLLQSHVLDRRLGIENVIEHMSQQHAPTIVKRIQRIQATMTCCLDSFSHPIKKTQEAIPRILWQTYKSKSLPAQMYSYIETWQLLNPSLRWCYSTDSDIESYLPTMFPQSSKILQTYRSFPLAVMRADFWRYIITYSQGGCYADVDAISLRAMDDWFIDLQVDSKVDSKIGSKADLKRKTLEELFQLPEDQADLSSLPFISTYYNSSWETCRVIIGLENDNHFCQWSFCSVAGHPLLEGVIQRIVARAEAGIMTNLSDFVHYYTGPAVFSHGKNLCSPTDLRLG